MKKKEVIPDKKKVFICYRRETSSIIANSLAKELNDKFDVYLDKNDKRSGKFKERIQNYIDNECTHFILVIDKETFKFEGDDNVRFEIEQALKKYDNNQKLAENNSIEIIPIVHNGYQKPKSTDNEVEKRISDFNWIEYDEKKDTFEKVISDVLKMLEYDESEKAEEKEKEERKKKRFWITLLSIAAVALLVSSVFGGTQLQKYITTKAQKIPEMPKLVFAGGGSVKNVIKKLTHDSVDIKSYENSIYLDLPSENAWALMAEEVIIDHTSVSQKNKFYPVCLSAKEANPTDFLKGVDQKEFEKNGTILSYRFKDYDDPLIVYSDLFKEKQGTITFENLSKLIIDLCNKKDSTFKVYITRERSGTYSIYNEKLNGILEKKPVKSHLDYYNEGLETKNLPDTGRNCIVLSSKYYTPVGINDLHSKMMVNEGGDTISKPMYLYFAGYTKEDSGFVNIPEPMVNFLKKIDNDPIIKTKMRQRAPMVITPFNTLKYWEIEYQKSNNKNN